MSGFAHTHYIGGDVSGFPGINFVRKKLLFYPSERA
jgi:hypothetical protein